MRTLATSSTFKQRADLSPAGNAPLAGVLAQGDLQEEDRNAAGEQEDHVRDEECTWKAEIGWMYMLYWLGCWLLWHFSLREASSFSYIRLPFIDYLQLYM